MRTYVRVDQGRLVRLRGSSGGSAWRRSRIGWPGRSRSRSDGPRSRPGCPRPPETVVGPVAVADHSQLEARRAEALAKRSLVVGDHYLRDLEGRRDPVRVGSGQLRALAG